MRRSFVAIAIAAIWLIPTTAFAESTDKDCPDFKSQAEAQKYFRSIGGTTSNNADRLDANSNGVACEDAGLPPPKDLTPATTPKGTQPEVKPVIVTNAENCEAFSASVTNVPLWVEKVRFQFAHDEVKFVAVSEQDTAASFNLAKGKAPAGGWGFSVRFISASGKKDVTVYDKEVTIKKCVKQTTPTNPTNPDASTPPTTTPGELPFTGPSQTVPMLVAGLVLLLLGTGMVRLVQRDNAR